MHWRNVMDEEESGGLSGFGWLMLIVGIVGVVGFVLVAAGGGA